MDTVWSLKKFVLILTIIVAVSAAPRSNHRTNNKYLSKKVVRATSHRTRAVDYLPPVGQNLETEESKEDEPIKGPEYLPPEEPVLPIAPGGRQLDETCVENGEEVECEQEVEVKTEEEEPAGYHYPRPTMTFDVPVLVPRSEQTPPDEENVTEEEITTEENTTEEQEKIGLATIEEELREGEIARGRRSNKKPTIRALQVEPSKGKVKITTSHFRVTKSSERKSHK